MKNRIFIALAFITTPIICNTQKYQPFEFSEEIRQTKIEKHAERTPSEEVALKRITGYQKLIEQEIIEQSKSQECTNRPKRKKLEKILFKLENMPEYESEEIRALKKQCNDMIQTLECQEECAEKNALLEKKNKGVFKLAVA